MKRSLLLLTLLLLFYDGRPSLFASVEIYTLPYQARPALRKMLDAIDSAHYRIDAAIYSFTHKSIAKHLAAAARRGVRIRILFDRSSNLHNPKSRIGYLAKYRNIDVFTLSGRHYRGPDSEKALMHMKTMVIDNRRIVTGSANWTYSAFGKNYETFCIIDDYGLARKVSSALQRMAKEAKPY